MLKMDLPDIISGKVIPPLIAEKMLKDEQERKAHKRELFLNILINVGCVILGAILSNLSEILSWFSTLLSK